MTIKRYTDKKQSFAKLIILDILKKAGEATVQMIDEGFLNPRYSFTNPSRILFGLPIPRYNPEKIKGKKFISMTLLRLEKEGFVKRTGTRKNFLWHIIEKRIKDVQPPEQFMIELPAEDGKIRIVTFDIPERERWKRSKIRTILVMCGYKKLQQSVWLGKRPLPYEFIGEIKRLSLKPYLHIFEISKMGTLKIV